MEKGCVSIMTRSWVSPVIEASICLKAKRWCWQASHLKHVLWQELRHVAEEGCKALVVELFAEIFAQVVYQAKHLVDKCVVVSLQAAASQFQSSIALIHLAVHCLRLLQQRCLLMDLKQQ